MVIPCEVFVGKQQPTLPVNTGISRPITAKRPRRHTRMRVSKLSSTHLNQDHLGYKRCSLLYTQIRSEKVVYTDVRLRPNLH
ncbi:hypothetical protein H2248_011621 [Termitomyces sp. 'cryptogamus']|nr:hypothetical protein H2248_011621 [Termitomyces sp. 'cryptogamus']